MPIALTSPPMHPVLGESMPLAMATKLRINPVEKSVAYEMWFGKLNGADFLPMMHAGTYVHRNAPAETGYGTDPETNIAGIYETKPEDTSFTDIVATAVHVVDGTEQVGDVITAYDLISSSAIYPHEIAIRPELFAGTIL